MYRILFLIITYLLIGYLRPSYTQDFWETLSFPDSTAIMCIATHENGYLFIGAGKNGASGGVYRSGDTGQSWELVFDNGEFSVNPIEINDQGDIYIGKRGFQQLMVSYDNGYNWDSLYYPGSGNITAILSIGQDTLFVSSWEDEGAFLLRSYNNGSSWDTVFTTNNSNEYIKDIINTIDGDIYIGLTSYSENAGGVYKSVDGGNNWMFSGLFNQMISSLDINSCNDIFAGSRGILQTGIYPGLFVLKNGEDEWQVLVEGPFIEDVVINSLDHIFYSSNSVYRSLNNGITFEYIGDGLPSGPMGFMTIDNLGYIYLTSDFLSNYLARTINTTVSIYDDIEVYEESFLIYPNPVSSIVTIATSTIPLHNTYITISNTSGQQLVQCQITEPLTTIDIRHLPNGAYIVKVWNDKNMMVQKVIKQ